MSQQDQSTGFQQPVRGVLHMPYLQAKEEIAGFVHYTLKPSFSKRLISKEQYKEIARRATHKATNGRPPSQPSHLEEKEKSKIRSIVEQYIQMAANGKL